MTHQLAITPEVAAKAAAAAEADRLARREAVDPEVRARHLQALKTGAKHVPQTAREGVALVESFIRSGVSRDQISAFAELLKNAHGSTLAAILDCGSDTAADEAEREHVASVIDERLAASRLPDLDLADLFAEVPAVRDHVTAIAHQKRWTAAMPAMWALTVASALVADRVRLRVVENEATGEAWRLTAHFWTLGVYTSGLQKTTCYERMGTRIAGELGVAAREAWKPVRALDRRRRMDARRVLDNAKQSAEERDAAAEVLEQPAMAEPVLLFNVSTPEEFDATLFRSGFVALLQEEGSAFFADFIHQERGKLSAALGAFSGASGSKRTRTDSRAGERPPFHERHAVLGLLVQPHVVDPKDPKDRARVSTAAQEGLFARFLCHVDTGTSPACDLDADAVRRAGREFEELLRGIAFHLPDTTAVVSDKPDAALDDFAPLHPLAPRSSFNEAAAFAGRWLDFEPEAARRILDFQATWQKRGRAFLQEEEVALSTVCQRLPEIAAKLAGLLAILRAGRLDRLNDVSLSDVERAIRCCEGFAWPHVRSLLDKSQAGELEALETKILAALRDRRGEWLTYGKFRDTVAKRWPEVRGEAVRDRQPPLVRAFESLHKRGLVEKRATAGGRSFEVRCAAGARW